MYRHLLAPVDASDLSRGAARKAAQLAAALRAQLTFFHALPTPTVMHLLLETLPGLDRNPGLMSPADIRSCMAAFAEKHLDGLVAIARADGVAANRDMAETDHPHRAIIDAAERLGCDLIVMASHGRSGIGELLLGSVTHKVLCQGTIPVLVYRQAPTGETGSEENAAASQR